MPAHLILPLKFSPHAAELDICAAGRGYVVHDVDVNVIQHHHSSVSIASAFIHQIAKDRASFRAADLDIGPAALCRLSNDLSCSNHMSC